MKKKWIAAALSVVIAASLVGCSGEISNEYITIKQYKGLEVAEVEKTEVTDEQVENAINSYVSASQNKEEITDRAAADGDTVNIDYVGTIDGVAFDGGTASGIDLVLGSGSFLGAEGDYKGFEEQVVGHEKGDNFDITVKFPTDYRSTDVADKVANFNITLNGIYQVTEAELNDEWVQANSEKSKTVEEYKKEIRENLEKNYETSWESELKSNVLEAFMEQVEVKELPEEKVQEQYQAIEDNYKNAAKSYGLEFEDYLNLYMGGMTEEAFKAEAQNVAETAVKNKLACELLAEKKKLEPSEEEYEEKMEEYAESFQYTDVDAFKEAVGEDTIKAVILQEKVAEYLMESCVQVEASSDSE